MTPLPLLAPGDLDAPMAWRDGVPLSRRRFLADAGWLADRLPARQAVVNLCVDRYHFAVGLAAALLRGQTSLLPPNALPDTLARLGAAAPAEAGLGALADGPLDAPGLPLLSVVLPAAPPAVATVPQIAGDHVAACLLTSGSTGTPQPHAKRWDALVANIGAAAARLAWHLERPDLHGLNVVATVPAQHSYGLESSVLLALLGGAAFDAGRPFYPADVARALQRLPRPRALVTTPFHLKAVLQSGVALPPTDLLLCATAPLSPQLALQAERAFGGPLIEIYGCTEAGQVASRRPVAGDVWQTFGALRVRRASDGAGGDGAAADADRYLAEGGHVAVPTPLADVLQLVEPDAGTAASAGFRLLGRAGDVIHVAGKRSSLAHLDFHLNSLDGVVDGACWLPDDVTDGVVRPVALVVAPTLTAADVIAGLRQRLEPMFVPRRVLHVAALPRAATGKLTAQALRAFALTALSEAAAR